MSTKHTNDLYLVDYADVDRSVPDLGLTMLPGRAALLMHPLNAGSGIVLPDREVYDPDVCTVAQSPCRFYEPGDVAVVMFDMGAYYPDLSPDGREVRLVGCWERWDEFMVGKLGPEGFAAGPGWLVVDVEPRYTGPLATPDGGRRDGGAIVGTVVSGARCGERVATTGDQVYGIRGGGFPDSWVVVRDPEFNRKPCH